MAAQMIRHTMLALALSLIPGLAAAAGSQAGDSGKQPIGADNEGPRVSVPNQALADDGAWSSYDHSGYHRPYYANGYYYAVPGDAHAYYYTAPSTTYYVAPPTTYYSTPPTTDYSTPPTTYYSVPPTTYYSTPPTAYYSAPRYYAYNGRSYTFRNRDEAWAYCDTFPLAERPACRDALVGPY